MSTTVNNLTGAPPSDLHELIRARWSPRAFLDRAVEPEKLRAIFEAARWAASCFNEQPWRFVVATKSDPAQFARMLGLLVEKNREWAKTAYLLGFSTGKMTFTRIQGDDRYGLHDAGAASANLALRATALGLHAHFMGGFDIGRARSEFAVPAEFEIGAALAVGYIDEATVQPGVRTRKPLMEIVFSAEWGKPAGFIGS
jgi:nitroreductase